MTTAKPTPTDKLHNTDKIQLTNKETNTAAGDNISSFSFFDCTNLIFGEKADYVKQQNSSPIGVFDSGMGGLSILQHLQTLMPYEDYVYLADTKHVPYGERNDDEIQTLTHKAVDWLYAQGCKLVVVACNSASAHSLDSLRPLYGAKLPIVGLVPAIKPAAIESKSKHIAVLATKATLKGKLLADVIDQYATPLGVQVQKYFYANLVPWVEAGMPKNHQGFTELTELISTLQTHQVDHLVLGCTHYPFFKDTLAKLAPWLITLDSGEAIARRTSDLLTSLALVNDGQNKKTQSKLVDTTPSVAIFSSGDVNKDKTKIQQLFIHKTPAIVK